MVIGWTVLRTGSLDEAWAAIADALLKAES
jgi:hypothetical protein